MSWAARRRLVILLIAGAIIVAFVAIVLIATLYKTPSCTDGIQNQDEAGIDCGGPCAYLCTIGEQPPIVLFTKVLENGAGRTDVAAVVVNKNPHAAARNVPYRITLYDTKQVLLQTMEGTIDLPPGASLPIYIPGVLAGKQEVGSAFLEIAASAPQWFTLATDPRIIPTVVSTTLGGTASAPRVDAVLANSTATPLSNVRVIIFVWNAQKDLIGASQTVVPSIPAGGKATAVFTWNAPFEGDAASLEVEPVIPLSGSTP